MNDYLTFSNVYFENTLVSYISIMPLNLNNTSEVLSDHDHSDSSEFVDDVDRDPCPTLA